MHILPTCLFLIITFTIIHAQIFQGQLAEQTREKRQQNNIYDFVRHLILPQDYSSFYEPPLIVNVNQRDSNPSMIINNQHPEYSNQCPCERYERIHGELQCLCPRKKIYTKCDYNKVCIEKRFCEHGLLFDTRALQTINRQNNLCDEATHVCCLPPTEIRHESTHQISNHNINSTIDRLNNMVTKYVVGGNLYVNNGNPTTPHIIDKFGTGSEGYPYIPVSIPGILIPNGIRFTGNLYTPGNQIPNGVLVPGNQQFLIPNGGVNSQFMYNQLQNVPNEENQDIRVTGNQQSNGEKNPVHLNSVTTTEVVPSQHTVPPNLVRPTRPPIASTTPVYQSTLQTGFPEITTFRPSPVTQENDELLSSNELASIFGVPDVTENPTLQSGDVSSKSTEDSNQNPEIGVSIIENAPLSMMDFPQPGFQAPMKKPEVFLTGKIERFRTNDRTNSTTTSSISTSTMTAVPKGMVQGIGQRIFVEGPSNIRPTAPAFTQVQEQDMFSFQESMEYTLPTDRPSQFSQPPGNTPPVLRSCPSAMKCVQERYCTPEGLVSTVPVILTKEEEARKNMLLTCGDEDSGQIGKCCFDKNS